MDKFLPVKNEFFVVGNDIRVTRSKFVMLRSDFIVVLSGFYLAQHYFCMAQSDFSLLLCLSFMLQLDIARICNEKGVSRPVTFLKSIGFHPSVITQMLAKRRSRLNYEQIEKLCLALRCTPNELFDWQPPEGTDATQPMQTLVRNKPGIAELLHALPPEKIEEVRELMMKMRAGG